MNITFFISRLLLDVLKKVSAIAQQAPNKASKASPGAVTGQFEGRLHFLFACTRQSCMKTEDNLFSIHLRPPCFTHKVATGVPESTLGCHCGRKSHRKNPWDNVYPRINYLN